MGAAAQGASRAVVSRQGAVTATATLVATPGVLPQPEGSDFFVRFQGHGRGGGLVLDWLHNARRESACLAQASQPFFGLFHLLAPSAALREN
jgi:hypothetical protein